MDHESQSLVPSLPVSNALGQCLAWRQHSATSICSICRTIRKLSATTHCEKSSFLWSIHATMGAKFLVWRTIVVLWNYWHNAVAPFNLLRFHRFTGMSSCSTQTTNYLRACALLRAPSCICYNTIVTVSLPWFIAPNQRREDIDTKQCRWNHCFASNIYIFQEVWTLLRRSEFNLYLRKDEKITLRLR